MNQDLFRKSATAIAALYKSRWQVELFFKWIKQRLCIQAFYGTRHAESAMFAEVLIGQ